MAGHQDGTLTFLFTDIEGSTALIQRVGDRRFADLLSDHHRLTRTAFESAGCRRVEDRGDGFLATFARARDAVAAAVEAQRSIVSHPWPEHSAIRVRMGLHTGEPVTDGSGVVGLDVHRAARICAAGYGGQILLSQTTRDLVDQELPLGITIKDLGEHRLKDLQRPERVFQILHPELTAEFPPLRTLDTLPNNLPRQLTSFIGRSREIAEINRLLSEASLLTLTGAGGSGKTRLALQVAAGAIDQFPDGTWVAELAAVGDPALVPRAAASALGVQEEPGRPMMATLLDYLHPKDLLLMLDNCEHLLAACSQLAETLLKACPRLKMLATSREGLGISGELTYRVPSLGLPDLRTVDSIERLSQCESVRLFVERARFSSPLFELTADNGSAVGQICQRLDGIPLALELAAARVKVLTAEQIADRLDDRFRLLTGGSRTAMPRQQTLRAAMDWSYELLSPPEQALMRRLSVFVGGFTLEAAEAVCAGDAVVAPDVLDLLTRLVDKSLVGVEERERRARYRLLETVRQYGRDKLMESGEAPVFRDRHRDFFLALAEEAESRLRGPEQLSWLNRLEVEHDNLRGALEWAVGGGHAEAGMRMASALSFFWFVRGYLYEGREWLSKTLSIPGEATAPAKAGALYAAGFLARIQGDFAETVRLSEQALALYRELGDRRGMASALMSLGVVARVHGDYPRSMKLLEESLALRRESGDKWGIAVSLEALSLNAWIRGDYESATTLVEESLSLRREIGDQLGEANALSTLATVAHWQGNTARSADLAQQSLDILRKFEDRGGIAMLLINLASVAIIQGDYVRATALGEEAVGVLRELGGKGMLGIALHVSAQSALHTDDIRRATVLLRESLDIFSSLNAKTGIANNLIMHASLALARGQARRAAVLIGAGEAIREVVGTVWPPGVRKLREQTLDKAGQALGESMLGAARAEGRALTLEQAVALARSQDASQ